MRQLTTVKCIFSINIQPGASCAVRAQRAHYTCLEVRVGHGEGGEGGGGKEWQRSAISKINLETVEFEFSAFEPNRTLDVIPLCHIVSIHLVSFLTLIQLCTTFYI